MTRSASIVTLLVALLALGACESSRSKVLAVDEDQVRLRAIQTRAFDTTDEQTTLRTIIATMQDLGFVLDDANAPLGIVTGTKFQGYTVVRLTVTIRCRGETQTLVRANAQQGMSQITDAETYVAFFTALSKAMFLTAHDVD